MKNIFLGERFLFNDAGFSFMRVKEGINGVYYSLKLLMTDFKLTI
jgi:hypothetical protein